jgi:hypothetical protein
MRAVATTYTKAEREAIRAAKGADKVDVALAAFNKLKDKKS